MTKNDIIVGAIYTNEINPGYIYLGIGRRIMWQGSIERDNSNFEDKNLVVISPSKYAGMIVQDPENAICGLWEEFKFAGFYDGKTQ